MRSNLCECDMSYPQFKSFSQNLCDEHLPKALGPKTRVPTESRKHSSSTSIISSVPTFTLSSTSTFSTKAKEQQQLLSQITMGSQTCPSCKRSLLASDTANNGVNIPPHENESVLSACQHCKGIHCSPSCQLNDKLHDALCPTYDTFLTSNPRPLTSHKLALLLPEDADAPRFIWLKTQVHRSNWESSVIELHLGPDEPTSQSILMDDDHLAPANPKESPSEFKSTLIAEMRSSYANDNSLKNYCIEKLVPAEFAQQWRGPVVISLKTGPISNTPGGAPTKPAFYSDFILANLYKLQDLLKIYAPPSQDIIQGVRIRCQGEVNHFNKPAYSIASIPKDHVIFSDIDEEKNTIPVSATMKVPILIFKAGKANYAEQDLTATQKQAVQNDQHFNKNLTIRYLTIDTDVRSKTWGSLDKMHWGDDPGTVLFARKDRKPLSPRQVEAIVYYCRDVLFEPIQKVKIKIAAANLMRGGRTEMKEQMTRSLICQTSFEKYFELLKKMRGTCDGSWAEEKSIFSI